MPREYYYFVSSLPMLSFEDEKIPIKREDFLSDCRRLLSTKDYTLMEKFFGQIDPLIKAGNDVLDKWLEFEHNLKNEMVFYRCQRLKKDFLSYVRGSRSADPYLVDAIQGALKSSNLFSFEKMMDFVRWEFLEELSLQHYFDFEYLLIYSIKLQILERQAEFNSPRGKDIFEEFKSSAVMSLQALFENKI